MSLLGYQIEFDSNTWMVVSWWIISQNGCIISVTIDTQIWNELYMNVSFANIFLAFKLVKFDQLVIYIWWGIKFDFDYNTWMAVPWGIISKKMDTL